MGYPFESFAFAENVYRPESYEATIICPEGEMPATKHPCWRTYQASRPFIRQSRTAIDVGCRMGEYSRWLGHDFARLFGFDARIHPNFAKNVDLANVTLFECALGDEAGTIQMSGAGHRVIPGKVREVPVLRLDDFGLTEVDYIKIDVEGFEQKVMIGGEETILRDRPLIVIEQNDVVLEGQDKFAAKAWLEARGYVNVAVDPKGWDYVMQYPG